MIAALYVAKGGCYFGLPDVDPWDESRDARLYAGPWPVVAHPPCERWGNYYFGSPTIVARTGIRQQLGDDDGCFAAALAAVRTLGGVLEHPAGSRAWAQFGLTLPPPLGWGAADFIGGWTCRVEQGHYGHRARKPTWLYACHVEPPSLRWGPSQATAPHTIGSGHDARNANTPRSRGARTSGDAVELMTHEERRATPPAFRDLLLSIARSATSRRAA